LRQIDRLIMKELVSPWLFGVGLFSALLMAATYLGRLTGLLVDQVPPAIVGQLFMLYLPAMLVKTFTMAVLLAALLAFGRLSSDSEIVSLRAAGASILRIVWPVMIFSVLIAGVTFWFDEQVVPASAQRSKDLFEQIIRAKQIQVNQPFSTTVVQHGKLAFGIVARNVNPMSKALQGVTIVVYDKDEKESYIMSAKEIAYTPGLGKWRVDGGLTLTNANYTNITHAENAWPSAVQELSGNWEDVTDTQTDAFDVMSMTQLRAAIKKHTDHGDWKEKDIANAEYGYWNKLAVPLAAFVFGTLGAVLGIRNHRTGTAVGFALAVAIIFGYVTLANFMNVWAMRGLLPPYAASFAPVILGLIASAIIMWRRNA